jgi:hypothetical protein
MTKVLNMMADGTSASSHAHDYFADFPRCQIVQYLWDSRRDNYRNGRAGRIDELDDAETAALLDWDRGVGLVPDHEYDGEEWDYHCRAAQVRDAKVRKQPEAKIVSDLSAREAVVPNGTTDKRTGMDDATSPNVEVEKGIASAAPTRNDFIMAMFANTEGPTFVCSYPNERDDPAQADRARSSAARAPRSLTSSPSGTRLVAVHSSVSAR